MATTQMSRDDAAALSDRTLRAMHPDKVLQDRLEVLQHELEKRFAAGLRIPLDGSEADAVQSVKDQLEALGVTASDESEIQKIVRDARPVSP